MQKCKRHDIAEILLALNTNQSIRNTGDWGTSTFMWTK